MKWCENRSWEPTNLKPSKLKTDVGLPRILIHASSRFDSEAEGDRTAVRSAIIGSVRLLGVIKTVRQHGDTAGVVGVEFIHNMAEHHYRELRSSIQRQAVRQGIEHSDKRYKLDHGYEHVGCPLYDETLPELYWWMFDKPIRFTNPIPIKGQLNIWKYVG